jgi:protein-tyrosine phosphatase
MSITTPAVMAAALDAIDGSLSAGRGVYVHCFGGIGRTGMVVGAWMIRRGLATPDDVMAKLARLRKKDEERASRRSPETEAQIAFMKTWSAGRTSAGRESPT